MNKDKWYNSLLLDGPLESESQRFSVKLADFGLAKTEDQAQEMKTGLMGTFVSSCLMNLRIK